MTGDRLFMVRVCAVLAGLATLDGSAQAREGNAASYSPEFGGRVLRAIGGAHPRSGEPRQTVEELAREGDVEAVLMDVIRWGLERRPLDLDVDHDVIFSTAPMDAAEALGRLGSRRLLAEAVEFLKTSSFPGPMPDEKTVSRRDPLMVRWDKYNDRFKVYKRYVAESRFFEAWDALRDVMIQQIVTDPQYGRETLSVMLSPLKEGPTDQLDKWIAAAEPFAKDPKLAQLAHQLNPDITADNFNTWIEGDLEKLKKWRSERKESPPPANGQSGATQTDPPAYGQPGSAEPPGRGSGPPKPPTKTGGAPEPVRAQGQMLSLWLILLALALVAAVTWGGLRALRRRGTA